MNESMIIGALLIFGGIFLLLANFTSILNLIGALIVLAGFIILIMNLRKRNNKLFKPVK
ncbi:hypothetical protein J4438_02550 [Candidatus Woesearchaeota archaeon]|nr:hypothetical protein [Candidatus Woesearchaeota archaeon]